MTPKEKASELANRFVTKSVFDMNNEELGKERISAKKHATTCVDEIIKETEIISKKFDLDFRGAVDYWEIVKDEINKLKTNI